MSESVTKYLPDDWTPEAKEEFIKFLDIQTKKKRAPAKYTCWNCGHAEGNTDYCNIGSGDCVNQVFNKQTPFYWMPKKDLTLRLT